MKFIVDDTEIDAANLTGGTIEEALRKVQTDIAPPGNLVVALRCDGNDVPGAVMAEMIGKPVADFDRLEVFTATPARLVGDAMDQALSALDETGRECRRVAELLAEGRITDGIQALGGSLVLWQQIHDAIGKSLTMLDVDVETTLAEGGTLLEMIEKPKTLLLEIKQALTTKDHVLLADIMQYEFDEVAGTWRAILELLRAKAAESDV